MNRLDALPACPIWHLPKLLAGQVKIQMRRRRRDRMGDLATDRDCCLLHGTPEAWLASQHPR